MFACTLFVSATLLFLVQPMIGKMLLPLMGGTPAVWNTCMVFFQAVLLAGYLYVHALTRLEMRRQIVLHTGLLMFPFLALPITVHHWFAPSGAHPSVQVLGLLLASVGLPFFVVSSSAPLLQKWFSSTAHPTAHDPYFLYSASNLGSMVALLSYPVLIEPHLRLVQQGQCWMVGYAVLVVLMVGCAVLVWRSHATSAAGPRGIAGSQQVEGPSWRGEGHWCAWSQRARWVVLAFVPSSLMLGMTTYVTTDLTPVPLLWVLPLALYLLSFILVFARLPQGLQQGLQRIMVWLLPVVVLVLVFSMTAHLVLWPFWMTILLHLAALFVVAMVCHGELARRRPPALQLTAFYLWISVGGVLGGLFNALLAPLLFKTVAEYPLALVLACLLLPRAHPESPAPWSRCLDLAVPVALAVLTLSLLSDVLVLHLYTDRLSALLHVAPDRLLAISKQWLKFDLAKLDMVLKFAVPVILCSFCAKRPVRFGLSVGALLLVSLLWQDTDSAVLYRERSFFGILKVERTGNTHKLLHSTTLHGMQNRDPFYQRTPLTYYHPNGPIGQVFTALAGTTMLQHIALIGLGTGTLAAYGEPGQSFTFYEIDPAVQRIASDQRYFTYIQDSIERGVTLKIELGDARLKIAEAADGQYGLIVLDAFSSDAIPVHLITREALHLYLAKLSDGGLVAIHISNRYLDLAPVLGNLAQAAHLVGLIQSDSGDQTGSLATSSQWSSSWVVLARHAKDLGTLAADAQRWRRLAGRTAVGVWTDDFSNLFSVFQWQR
jgi:spermidine synthase